MGRKPKRDQVGDAPGSGTNDAPSSGWQLDALVLWLCAVVIRVPIATGAVTLPVHPDSIHQSLEMAHLWAYGSGFRTLEFVQPEYDDAWDFFVGSPEQQASAHRSQYAMRFPLLPGFFYVLFRLCTLLGVNDYHSHVLPFAQTVFAAVTATLPAAVYSLLRVLFADEPGVRSAALLSGVLVAAHPALATLGGNALLNSFLAPFTFAGLAGWCGSDTPAALRALSGATLAVAVYVRCDLLLLCGSFAAAHPLQVLGGFRRVSVLAAIAAAAAMAAVDWALFEFPLATPVRWFVFNVYLGHSHMFGTSGDDHYVQLLINDALLQTLSIAGVGALVLLGSASPGGGLRPPQPLARTVVPKALKLALAACAVVGVHSLGAHKEGRFIHDALVLLLAALSLLLAPLAAAAPARLGSPHTWLVPPLLAAAVAISSQARGLPGTTPGGPEWFAPFWGSARRWQQQADVNAAIAFVGARGNATGLMLRMPASGNGHLPFACTWTCLHVAAPIAVLRPDHHVQVFSPAINTDVCTAPVLAMPTGVTGEDQQILQLHRTSRWVLRNRRFNYLVTPAPLAPRLAALGFQTIAEIGTAIVAQRRAASEVRADSYDYWGLWAQHAQGWLCHQYFRHAAAVPIVADVRLGLPLPGGATGEHAIRVGGSARDGAVDLCTRMGRRADDFECLYEMHGAIGVATVEHVYSNDAAQAREDALSAAPPGNGPRVARGPLNEHADDGECARWAVLGECERNPGFMKKSCAASCAKADVREPPLPLKRPLGARLPPGRVLSVHRAYLEVEVPRYEYAFVALVSPALDGDTRRGVSETLQATAQQFAVAQPGLDLLFAEALVGPASEDSARVEEAGGVLCLFFTRRHRNPRYYEGASSEARAVYEWVDRTIRSPDSELPPPGSARRYSLSPEGEVLEEAREVRGFDRRLQAFARSTRDASYRAFNPSIHGEAAGDLWVAFRVSNNTRCAGVDVWRFVGLQQMLISDLAVCQVGEDLLPIAESCHYVSVDFEALARQSAQEGGSWMQTQGLIRGFEDPRLFRLNGQWAMLVTVLVTIWSVEASGCRIALVLLDDSLRRVTSAHILSVDDTEGAYTPARFEKNWAPLVVKGRGGEEVLLLAYSWVPLILLRPSMRDGRCTRVEVIRRDDGSMSVRPAPWWKEPKIVGMPQVTTAFGFGSPDEIVRQKQHGNELPRGGSQLVQVDDGRWIGLTHSRVETYLGPLYNTHFVELVPNPTGPANEEDDEECARWAAQGECESNLDFMEESCAASCASDGVQSRGLLKLQLSLAFRFPHSNASKAAKQAIQMVMGLTPRRAYEKKKKRWGRLSSSSQMIVSFGIGDCSAHLALTTLKHLRTRAGQGYSLTYE